MEIVRRSSQLLLRLFVCMVVHLLFLRSKMPVKNRVWYVDKSRKCLPKQRCFMWCRACLLFLVFPCVNLIFSVMPWIPSIANEPTTSVHCHTCNMPKAPLCPKIKYEARIKMDPDVIQGGISLLLSQGASVTPPKTTKQRKVPSLANECPRFLGIPI